VHAQRLQVFSWGADNAAAVRRLVDYRVDGIISDRPEAVPR
jgi:glycerophosphoryl diester phosphodiesterase